MNPWIKKLLDKLKGPQKSPRVPPTKSGDEVRKGATVARDLIARPSLETPRRKTEAKVALQVGFDFGTHSTKIVVRRRGELLGSAICVGGSVEGYPGFVVPSLVRVSQDALWFGGAALNRSDGTLYRLLKLELLKLEPSTAAAATDFLVTAYFSWILAGVRDYIGKRYGLDNAKLFLNVAAPMDHYEDVRVKQRYLKILRTAWDSIFGGDQKLVAQGVTKATFATWFANNNLAVPDATVRPYDVLPETIAPIVSLSQDARMTAGMYMLVDMGAGTTELSINHVSVPGGDQNVLCYFDRSVLLGAERFQSCENPSHLTAELLKHIWQTWCHGYEKDARNVAARQRWKSLRILLVGGGTCRTDVYDAIIREQHAVCSRFPGEGRCEILRHGPADLDFGPVRISPEDVSLASVANGLAFPRMKWPRFYEPEQVRVVPETPTRGGPDPWYMDR